MKRGVRRSGFLADVWYVVRREKKWWLVPLILILLLATALMLVAGSAGPLAPFLYPFL
jgi:hypothetical protein